MTRAWFVTGTDTGVGKTLVSAALLTALGRRGRRAVGMKPVASGCDATSDGLRSNDAEILRYASNVSVDYADCNPYALEAATSPHLAAAAQGLVIDIQTIQAHYARLAQCAQDVVIEGVGGWLAPINPAQTMADVVSSLDIPVILVVGLRLGCLSHALLTERAIAAHGCRMAAWVGTACAGEVPDGYVESLRERLRAPCLGVIPVVASTERALEYLDLSVLE